MEEVLDSLSKELKEAGKHKDCHNEYASLKTDEERVKFTMRILHEYKKIIIAKPSSSSKNTTESIKYRNEGNRFFVNPMSSGKPQLNHSIEMYTKSIVYAPKNSKELALAFANRSASLFKARLYSDCMLDIERALKLPYPDNLKAKLLARKARCLMASRSITSEAQKVEIDKALEDTREWLEKMDTGNQARKIVEKTLNDSKIITGATVEKKFIKWNPQRYLPSLPKDNSTEIPNVSSALEIKYTEKFGKHIVATRDIEPGEVLAIMNPYACVLVPEKFYTHCSYCTEQTWSSLPCEQCVNVIYCCEECREKAWEDHHSIECQVIGPLVAMEMSNLGLLSLRLIVRAVREAESMANLKKKVLAIDALSDLRINGFTNGILNDRDYASVYTLARNTEKRSIPDLFGRSLNATYIVFMLATRSDLFGKKFEGCDLKALEENEWITFIGGLIMRHQQIIPSNGHSLTEEDIAPVPIERAAALMPFYSLINHSCNPSVTRISHGKQIILYADHTIPMGEQVFDNYGLHYALDSKSYRQSKLMQQFRFTCECNACTENWPTYFGGIPSFFDQVSLHLSHEEQVIRYAMRNFNKWYELATFGIIDNASNILADLNKMTKVLEEIVDLPCKEFNDVIETKKRILALLGNRFQSLD